MESRTQTIRDSEILRPLNDQELEELLELYRVKYGPENFQYLLIYNQRKWNKCLQEMDIEDDDPKWISFRKVFYTHRDGDFRTYGTYVCIHQDIMQSVSFHSWESNFNQLLECLRNTKLIHWKDGPLLVNVAAEYSEEVKQIAALKGTTIQRARSCQGVILNHTDAINLKIAKLPEGYRLEQLQEKHAELIHSLWANRKEGSLEYVKGLIKIDRSIGLFEETNSALVGWILQNEFNGIAVLEVLPTARRKGFGTILAATLSKLIAEWDDVNLSAWFVVGNVKSESLLQKVGYRKTVISEWIQLNKVE